jgi:hypothetical protein
MTSGAENSNTLPRVQSDTIQVPGSTDDATPNDDINTNAVDNGGSGEKDEVRTINKADVQSSSGAFSCWLLVI